MKSVFDRSFHYTPSVQTDIRKTFARIRREQRDAKAQQQAVPEKDGRVIRMRAIAKRAG